MSTSTFKTGEENERNRTTPKWLGGFPVLGSLLVLPSLLPVTDNLDIDADPARAGLRFLAFNVGFLAASALSPLLSRKLGLRLLALIGLASSAIGLGVLALQLPTPALAELFAVSGVGFGAGGIALTSLLALSPWSSRLRVRWLPRIIDFATLGYVFSCIVATAAYALGLGRFTPVPVALGALVCVLLCIGGRQPLAVIEKQSTPPDSRLRHFRSIASFLLLCLLFVQLATEWSVAGWLPLFLIHRLGSGPLTSVSVLAFYFLALMLGRFLARRSEPRFGPRLLAAAGATVALAGCLVLTLSSSFGGILCGLAALSVGLAPPYPVANKIINESLQFAPGFYRAALSVAVTGAMCAPWLLGYVHQFLGIGALLLFPAVGVVLVLVLQLLLMFESHLMSERAPSGSGLALADRHMS